MKRGRDASYGAFDCGGDECRSRLISALCAFRAEARFVESNTPCNAARERLIAEVLTACQQGPDVDDAAILGAMAALRSEAKCADSAAVIDVDEDTNVSVGTAAAEVNHLSSRIIDALRASSEDHSTLIARLERSNGLAEIVSEVASSSETMQFPSFRLNRTPGTPAAFSYTIRDLVLSQPTSLCVLMNFSIDLGWLNHAVPEIFSADRIVIIHGMDPDVIAAMLSETFDSKVRRRIKVVRPKTPNYGTVHSKAVLSFCGMAGCRIVVHTSNDEENDWLLRTQGAWHRDFPRKGALSAEVSDFEKSLVQYFKVIGEYSQVIPDTVIPEIKQYDFSKAGCSLITSVPGKHRGQDRKAYGHARLRVLLEQEEIDETGDNASVIIQFSSLGSIRQNWLEQEFKSSLFASLSRRRTGAKSAGEVTVLKSTDKLELVLPTMAQMAVGHESWAAGRALPVTGRNVHRHHIIDKLHTWCADVSGRSMAMPHIKTILRYGRHDPSCIDWIIIGSANLSGAAWGWTGGSRGGRQDMIEILSYEMGVLLTRSRYCRPCHEISASPMPSLTTSAVRDDKHYEFRICKEFNSHCKARSDSQSCSVNDVVELPLPYSLPPDCYGPNDVPWHVDPGGPGCGEESSRCMMQLKTLGAHLN